MNKICIIVYKPAGKHIFKRILKNCWDYNSDGAGFMWSHDNFLNLEKGYFSFRSFYKNYRRAENEHPESDFILHFRIATSGDMDIKNCHPFQIEDGIAMVHNGIFTDWSFANTKESDTALFCKSILAKLPKGFMDNKAILELLEQYCKQEVSKIIILSANGDIEIINSQAGVWDNDMWFSNNSYRDDYNTNFGFQVVNYGKGNYDRFVNTQGKSYNFLCYICRGWFDESEVTLSELGSTKWICYSCRHIKSIEQKV